MKFLARPRAAPPEGRPGLPPAAGVTLMVLGAALFAVMARLLVDGAPLTVFDVWLAQRLQQDADPAATRWLAAISTAHETLPVLAAGALLAARFWQRGQRAWLQLTVLALPGGMLLNWSLKQAFRRPRPHVSDYVLNLHSYSFPSGHTTAATLFYGVIALYLISRTSSAARRVAVVTGALACVLTVAFSRLYLGAHYLSDVIAAFGVGVFWLALCSTGVHAASERARARGAEPRA